MKKKKQLNLYVWEGVLRDYTSGIAFALASSEEEARAAIAKKDQIVYGDLLPGKPSVIKSVEGFAVWGGG